MTTNRVRIEKQLKRDAKTGKFLPSASLDKLRNTEYLPDAQEGRQELLPLSPKLERLLEDSWEDNEELYRALKDS